MNPQHLGITKSDYINILRNRNIKVSDNISMDNLLKTLKNLRKKDFRYRADARNVHTMDEMSNNDVIKARYTDYHQKKQNAISERLARLKLNKFSSRQNISTAAANEILRLNKMSRTSLKRIAKLRNIKNFNDLTKESLIYTLLRMQKSLYENNYFKYNRNDTDDRIRAKVNNIRIELARLENIITKEDRDKFRKELYEIENKIGLTDTQKNEIYNRLCEIARDQKKIRIQ